jgi:2-polyprenyl-3-methyl-5-hydroxy-6-metoxy-1,4-benzoquinol methylase
MDCGMPANLDGKQEAELRRALLEFYAETKHYSGWKFYNAGALEYFESKEGQAELAHQISGRLEWFRSTHLPWLDAEVGLRGASVLEVGAGTGASTVALLEAAAAHVDAVDIDAPALRVAERRVGLHGLVGAEFHCLNATELSRVGGRRYDLVLFFATLEHMTHAERMATMPFVWSSLLRPGAFLAVLDTPNRLWFFDHHTSTLPFYHWLPDDVAIDYACYVPRENLRRDFAHPSPDAIERLARWGRGVSYHDFELWLGPLDGTARVSGMEEYNRNRNPSSQAWGETREGRFHNLLRESAPYVPAPFFEGALNLVMRKP